MCITIVGGLWDIVINFLICLIFEIFIIYETKNIFMGQTMMPVGVDDYVVGLVIEICIIWFFFAI